MYFTYWLNINIFINIVFAEWLIKYLLHIYLELGMKNVIFNH